MKRAVLSLALCALGLTSLAQIQTSGRWEIHLDLLPTPALDETTLTLVITIAGWSLISKSTSTAAGFSAQEFGLTGYLGPIGIAGGLAFNPLATGPVTVTFPPNCDPQSTSYTSYTLSPPEYKWGWIEISASLIGLEFTAKVEHWAYPYYPDYAWPCCEPTTPLDAAYMRYNLGFTGGPFYITTRFEDCCTGITFKDLSFGFTDAPLCCGVTFSMKLYFSKLGFEYLLFTVKDIAPICCGIVFDASVKFTTTTKEVSLTPKFTGFGQLCVQVYGDVLYDPEDASWSLAIYGYKLRCEVGQCNSIEFMTALDVTAVEDILGDIFEGDEYEYLRFRFCGPGCCGGNYSVDVSVYFQDGGTLFGISRALATMSIPLLSNLSFHSTLKLPAIGAPELGVGWTFSF
ncbi:MAG: hypothetical protein NUV94_05640 [Candidatus Acetothermia bacterium]|jgi:hypothetical protein|nr:hypothetical protein [Candidatus Acetothermia bacterium]